MTSYKSSKLIAETDYLHIVAGKLIIPAMKMFETLICGTKQRQENRLALPNNTVKHRIVENDDYLSLQDININVLVQEKVEDAMKKCKFWSHHVATPKYVFRKLTELLQKYDLSPTLDEISVAIKEYLVGLKTNLQGYFRPINNNKAWTWNLFTVNIKLETNMLNSETESITEISYD